MTNFPSKTFLRNLGLLSERTQEYVDNTFSLVLQVLFLKHKRKQREYEETLLIRKRKNRKRKFITGPLLLKEKDVSSAIMLVDFHLNRINVFSVEARHDLYSLFGDFPLVEAERYYDTYLKNGHIKDVMGREIEFDDDGKRFLYKAHTADGEHVIAPENYVETRGKRLSWLKHLLEQTREIYRQVEQSWETFLYVGAFSIVVDKGLISEKTVTDYFLVVTRKEKGRALRFVTAYPLTQQLELFKHIEKAYPLSLDQQRCIQETNRLQK